MVAFDGSEGPGRLADYLPFGPVEVTVRVLTHAEAYPGVRKKAKRS